MSIEEAVYSLPATSTGLSMRGLTRCAEQFNEHVARLEKESFCSALLNLFIECSNLHKVELAVYANIGESNKKPYWPEVRYELDVTLSYFDEEGDDEGFYPEVLERSVKQLKYEYFTKELAEFCEDLTLSREQLFSNIGAPLYETPEALVSWIELDYKK